ncbi:MAG: recombinase family protein [Anaerolineae bacterium]|nr:recombinase family protein [Anaerolineae bacterium]
MKRAIIYDRASSEGQRDNWSRQDALSVGPELAQKHGFDVWETRQEVKSGEELANRPVMKGILEEIEAGEVQAIICQNISRLSRDEDGIDGRYIKQLCRENGCLIVTPDMVYDLSQETHDDMADFQFLGAKWYKRAMMKQLAQGLKARARQGKFMGGTPMLGYEVIYLPSKKEGGKPDSDLAIKQDEVPLVEKIFDLYIELGGNGTAKELNLQGYRKPRKNKKNREKTGQDDRPFFATDIVKIVQNPIYAGFVTWGKNKASRYLKDFDETMIYREELKIIPIEKWELANRERQRRVRDGLPSAKWTNHPFAKLVKCPDCGGVMYGITKRDKRSGKLALRNVYRCHQMTLRGVGCSFQGSISENVVAGAVIPFISQVLRVQLDLSGALEAAANKYGKTSIESGLEAETKAEIAKTQEAKQRIVKAVADGIFTNDEAAKQIAELRQKEQRLERELIKLSEHEKIRDDYLAAIRVLEGQDIEKTLYNMLRGTQKQRRILGRLLALIFEPASLEIRSEGSGSNWKGELVAYQFTEKFFELICRTKYEDRYADVIIPRGGRNIKAIEMVIAQIQRMLESGLK